MVKIKDNVVQFEEPVKEIRLFTRDMETKVVGVTIDSLNRVYITMEVVMNERI